MNWKIALADLDIGLEESAAVLSVLRTRWLSMGEVTRRFEEAFAAHVGARHAIAVANGTVGLHLACLAAGLGRGDEVILPSLTFVATAAAVLYTGAKPVFADISGEQDLTISPASIAEKITSRTRAIIVMHYGGYPCDLPVILELAEKHGLVVIEDAAHAPGAELQGRKLGTWGKVGVFSFFSNKNLATGEGGMMVTDDDAIAGKLRSLRSHAMTSLTWDRHQGHAWSYDVTDLGYNYRLDEIRAAIGLAQLRKLVPNNQRRRDLTALYHDLLRERIPEIALPFSQPRGLSAAHLLPILLPSDTDRIRFMELMKMQGVQTSIHYPPIHRFSYYRSQSEGIMLPVTEAVAARQVTLPLHSRMNSQMVKIVVEAARQSFQKDLPQSSLSRKARR